EDANTPVRRVCYIAQLVLSGDADATETRHQMLRGIEQLSQVLTDADSRRLLADASRAVLEDQHYQALKALRALLPREERLLAAGRA
nr:flagellar biosynthesis repressor FlbT [Tabrizicola sp.]